MKYKEGDLVIPIKKTPTPVWLQSECIKEYLRDKYKYLYIKSINLSGIITCKTHVKSQWIGRFNPEDLRLYRQIAVKPVFKQLLYNE